MASNRDPLKDYRINRRGRKVTSSSDRSKRAKKASAPRPTSSSTRASTKGSSNRVTTGQGGSRARYVKPKAQSTGLIGTRNTPATKSTYSGPPKTKGPTLTRISKQLSKAKAQPKFKGRGGLAAGATALTAAVVKNQSDLKQQRKDSEYNKGAAYRAQQKKLPKVKMPDAPKKTTAAQSFDTAFSKARKAGKKTLTWRGKSYTTKMAK